MARALAEEAEVTIEEEIGNTSMVSAKERSGIIREVNIL
jgi:hypothetical protein